MDETLVEQPVKGRGLGPDCQRETTGRGGRPWFNGGLRNRHRSRIRNGPMSRS